MPPIYLDIRPLSYSLPNSTRKTRFPAYSPQNKKATKLQVLPLPSHQRGTYAEKADESENEKDALNGLQQTVQIARRNMRHRIDSKQHRDHGHTDALPADAHDRQDR